MHCLRAQRHCRPGVGLGALDTVQRCQLRLRSPPLPRGAPQDVEPIPSDYDKAQPATFSTRRFDVRISAGEATFEFNTRDVEIEAEALEAVKHLVDVWQFSAALKLESKAFWLEFETVRLEEKDPVPGQVRLMAGARHRIEDSGDLTVVRRPPNYPTPPSEGDGVKLIPDVRSMSTRYIDCCDGHERLHGMAYYCLNGLKGAASQLPGKGQRRRKAAKAYRISPAVLSRIATLSSKYGRKAGGGGRPLNDDECRFLDRATKAIIWRLARRTHDPSKVLPQITLADFQT